MGGKKHLDAYRFYFLSKQTASHKEWKMDCRMMEIIPDLRDHLFAYLLEIFREHFFTIFNDNNYRESWTNHLYGLEHDCKQILRNLIIISDSKKFSSLCKNLVCQNNMYVKTNNDILNLIKDDPVISEEKDETRDNLSRLFDDISKDGLDQLMNVAFDL